MRKRVVLEKPIGQTPLECVTIWKEGQGLPSEYPATYAGRLDPMASGKLLVLLGDECKRQDTYRGLDKEYEIEVLLDLSTDTGDVLGMPAYAERESFPTDKDLRRTLRTEVGTHSVPYPAFSSKTVNGKPLFLYALEGTLDTIGIPTHPETIHKITLVSIEKISRDSVRERIDSLLAFAPRSDDPSKELGADFRQDAIRAAWDALFTKMPERSFMALRMKVICGSGTYMRTLAERIGHALGTHALALSIRRARIGKYLGTGIWLRIFG